MTFYRMIAQVFFAAALLFVSGNSQAADTDPSPIKTGGVFTVHLDSPKGCSSAKPLEQIDLLIKGIDAGIHPIGCDPANNQLTFELAPNLAVQNTSASRAAWTSVLGNVWASNPGFMRSLSYTVTQPAGTGVEVLKFGTLNLHILSTGKVVLGGIMVAITWISLIYLGKNSGIVRDSGNPGTGLAHRTYSLGRMQIAWWFAIILAAYIYIWVVTDGLPVMSSQALGLMGISGASGLISLGVDTSKKTAFPVSDGVLNDILTDKDGVTIHRFQMVIMTIVLGIFFAAHVITHLSMPEFDANTLAMLGISGLTYVGFKVPEKHAAKNASAQQSSTTNSDPKSEYTPLPETSGS